MTRTWKDIDAEIKAQIDKHGLSRGVVRENLEYREAACERILQWERTWKMSSMTDDELEAEEETDDD